MDYQLFSPYGLCAAGALIVAAAILCLTMKKQGGVSSALSLAGLCAAPGLIGARLFYCVASLPYFALEAGLAECFDLRTGGFLLYGAIAGAALGAWFFSRSASAPSFAKTLDLITLPGLVMIALCRMAEFFPFESVGTYVESEALHFFPLAVANEYGEWYLAIFALEALCALVIALVTLKPGRHDGDRFLRALLFYAAAQVVCESLRMDSCLRFGFVRASQVLSGVSIMLVLVVFCRRSRRSARWMWGAIGATLLCMGGVGAIEWALDKTNVPNPVLYALMILCCAGMTAWALLSAKEDKKA